MKLKCITVDDEPFSLKLISNFVKLHNDLELLASFNSVSKTLLFLQNNEVDCIFLDIEMPDLDGVNFAKILKEKFSKISLVFVSAYSKYAIEGFKISATDFILKPYSFEDFTKSVEKIKQQKRYDILEEKIENSIFVKVDSNNIKINLSEVLYVESMKDYVKIYMQHRVVPYIPLTTLKKIYELLNEDFIQINRSQIINVKKIQSYQKNSLILHNKKFKISEKYKIEFSNIVRNL